MARRAARPKNQKPRRLRCRGFGKKSGDAGTSAFSRSFSPRVSSSLLLSSLLP
jgi:hypothetical protein